MAPAKANQENSKKPSSKKAVTKKANGSVKSNDDKPVTKRGAKKKEPAAAKDTNGNFVDIRNSRKFETGEDDDPVAEKRKLEGNILKCLDLLQYGPRKDNSLTLKSVRNTLVTRTIQNLSAAEYVGKFSRRITSLMWHDKHPYTLASASKFGDILLVVGVPSDDTDGSSHQPSLNFVTKAEMEGSGPGYSIPAMKFDANERHILYVSTMDCKVARIDMAQRRTSVYHDTKDYHKWFCSLDVNFEQNMIVAGCSKGEGFQFALDGTLLNRWPLHTNKIHHLEFSKKDPNLLVSCGLGKSEGVRIWDVRCMRKMRKEHKTLAPMHSLEHNVGINCAKFSPVDGSRLMTSDQHDEIRVYQGPLWTDYLTIKHYHKQFQHITPIKADWHPVNECIVIGRYPPKVGNNVAQNLVRAIEFFDSYTGEYINAIYPPLDEICSLNAFNPTGEYLATGMNSKLVLWKPGVPLEVSENFQKAKGTAAISEATRNLLRGRHAREYSPESSDDDNDANEPPAKKRSQAKTKTVNGSKTKTAEQPASSSSGTKKRSSKKK